MSRADDHPHVPDPQDPDTEAWVRENYEAIEREAESNAPDAWVFQRLLELVDDPDESDTGEPTEGST